jgi:hypothetical protein
MKAPYLTCQSKKTTQTGETNSSEILCQRRRWSKTSNKQIFIPKGKYNALQGFDYNDLIELTAARFVQNYWSPMKSPFKLRREELDVGFRAGA